MDRHTPTAGLLTLAAALFVFLPSVVTAEEPIVSLTERIGMLEEQDQEPLVQVFASGRLLVHRPSHWKNPGDFETQLSNTELDELLVELLDLDMAGVDEAKIAAAKTAARAAGGANVRIYVSDPNEIIIDLNVPGVAGRAAVNRQIRHNGVRGDAMKFPGISEIQSLAAATDRLRALTSESGLRAVK
ncbi:MAG: hypothetical protein ACI8TX_003163 [Hyphomicrobiaceae bacterium]|jgi:hypothetical protein